MVTLAELKQRLDELSPTAILFVSRMVESLSPPPLAHTNSKNTWLPPEWIEYFGLALSVHHGTTHEPLAQRGFETVFRSACESVDWAVKGPISETQRFLDLEIQPEIFRSLEDAPLEAFNADGPTIDCSFNGCDVAARVSLDRSDAKITIKQIQLDVCNVHVEWEMTSS